MQSSFTISLGVKMRDNIIEKLEDYIKIFEKSPQSAILGIMNLLKNLKFKEDPEIGPIIVILSKNKPIARILALTLEETTARIATTALDPLEESDLEVLNGILAISEKPPTYAILNATNVDIFQEKLIHIMEQKTKVSEDQQLAAISRINSDNITALVNYEETTFLIKLTKLNKAVRDRIRILIERESNSEKVKTMSFIIFGKLCEKKITQKTM